MELKCELKSSIGYVSSFTMVAILLMMLMIIIHLLMPKKYEKFRNLILKEILQFVSNIFFSILNRLCVFFPSTL